MIRRRGHGHEDDDSSSSDEEDAFSALSKKGNAKKKAKKSEPISSATSSDTNDRKIAVVKAESSGSKSTADARESHLSSVPLKAPISLTSSMKRHHKPSDTRKAKMDALLQELEAEKDQMPKKRRAFVPEKKGSFVAPGEEHLTTNLFVGNLSPSITEEDLSNLFSQFGELYSVKIMWPRTQEEKNRRRNTGFVCFMHREDAEEALEACDEADPFNNGRRLMLRWGKSVKKVKREGSTKSSATKRTDRSGAVSKLQNDDPKSASSLSATSKELIKQGISNNLSARSEQKLSGVKGAPEMKKYDPDTHAATAIRVEKPKDQSRFHFISTIASYVAKDPELEQRLKDEETGNSAFEFLTPIGLNDEFRREKLFYRWRVYSFCQGDTYSIWRTEPFLMFPKGRYWLPPPLDTDAVSREKANVAEKERRQRQQKEDRANRELMTGRQFERRKRRGEFGANSSKLNPEELGRFDILVRKQLSISRRTICEAMSFCFDNCMAAREVSDLVKDALLDESDHVTNDMRIARLYLLSDILFNSQQPGVRNAFMYRTTIESMAADVFRELGNVIRRKERKSGRITVNKIRKAVSLVLGAWTEWGVYNATFVDDLEAHFEGREVKKETDTDRIISDANTEKTAKEESTEEVEDVVIDGPRGDWKAVSEELSATKKKEIDSATKLVIKPLSMKEARSTAESLSPSGDEGRGQKDIDGKQITDDLDGEDLDGEDLDGEDLDGEDLDGEDLDGDDLDMDEDLDGEDLDGNDMDAEDLVDDAEDGDVAP